ncbi:hydantoinase B/oxoprolinase family protein [Desulforhopalus singaporensis]|uniref:N-methylhydantoinase B n=1 Tax=Desulforhopalus singaporensis TaxID=91360 RepID=A0A1H0U1W5_9BACT|nr:hydantoinase B/oxoprolinase family protein [Desulforhopalus singaporensis]SDP60183.1 N-methylhydantoinase B [Desulforhopalus singaporensis]
MAQVESRLDPVTFEVLKNAFGNLVDQMSEQILRTCYSFVIYCRDFSSALCDVNGDTIMQGSQDIAVHVGTLHLTAKAIIDTFGDDIHEGDVFIFNDPYVGGTHFCDVRIVRPVFWEGEIVAFTLTNGHWADVGGTVPGSFDISAKNHYGEGTRITPTRIWDKGRYLGDVANCLVANMRGAEDRLGDLRAQAEATMVGQREFLRLVSKYGKDTVLEAARECQDYVERITKARISELEDGTWDTVDFIDQDPEQPEALIPIKVKMTIKGERVAYDLEGSHNYIGCFLNSAYPATLSALIAGTKAFFPDIPLNAGFFKAFDIKMPENSVVNAPWPVAVTGFCSGVYEKVQAAVIDLWSKMMPERAMGCAFNLEYLLIGGWDRRASSDTFFMWYDWMAGGHGARSHKDGCNATAAVFGLGLSIQPCEGQERLSPVLTSEHAIMTDSAGPGKHRGGCGVVKGGTVMDCEQSVMSYCCDRSRSIPFGIWGGLPSIPQGLWKNKNTENEEFLGAIFSGVPVKKGDTFIRPSAGGGGLGDPLERSVEEVLEDVIDGYVSVKRAMKDYGVVIRVNDEDLLDYDVDYLATEKERAYIRANRIGWMRKDPMEVKKSLALGEIDLLDVIRRHGVIMDWGTGEVLVETTRQFREMLEQKTIAFWE